MGGLLRMLLRAEAPGVRALDLPMLEDCCVGVGARLRGLRRAAPGAASLLALGIDVGEAAALAAAALPPDASTETVQQALRIIMRLASAAAPLAASHTFRQSVMTLLAVCLTAVAGVNCRFNTWMTVAPQLAELARAQSVRVAEGRGAGSTISATAL